MSFILLGILNSQVEPAGGAGAFDLLQTTLISSNTASVTFSSLGSYSDYKHLQIRSTIRSNGTTTTGYRMQLNGDTGSNYAHHRIQATGSDVISASSGANASNMFLGLRLPGDSTANSFGASIIDILDFSSTNKNTTIRVVNGFADLVNGYQIQQSSGVWVNTAAVTSIEISQASDSFVAGSRFSLYGIKG